MSPRNNASPPVFLIGAGPGDPELLTLRGARCLARADVVLYDGLSNAEILRFAPHAEHICVGKHGQVRIWKQPEIIAEMLRHARDGKSVARLKGGDPAVFARTAEEVDALKQAGVPFEIIPGITAALAAGSYAGIPITHRKLASAVALVTGHEEPGKSESALDWDALARFPGTLVVYMGVTRAQIWTDALIAAGKDPATPSALVRRCSHPDQTTIHCRLDEITDRLTPASRFRPPVIAIIGPVTELAESMSWVQHRPLSGKTVLVTRPIEQATAMIESIQDQGGCALLAPAIEIAPLSDFTRLDRAIMQIPNTDLLVFCSVNGVKSFFNRLFQTGHDSRYLTATRIAVVGRKTAAALTDYGIKADVVPSDYSAAGLIQTLQQTRWIDEASDPNVLIVRASRGKDDLADGLKAVAGEVQQVVAYQNGDVKDPDPLIVSALEKRSIDWVTVTSSATAKNLVRLYGDLLRQSRLAAISPITAQTLIELGYNVDVVADPHTTESLLNHIAEPS